MPYLLYKGKRRQFSEFQIKKALAKGYNIIEIRGQKILEKKVLMPFDIYEE